MKRIIVIGSGGAGKSTLAEKLGKILMLPVYHLDTFFWLPGWVIRNNNEFVTIVKNLIIGEKWILDGNYQNTMELRILASDTVIFLDYNRFTCYWGVTVRYFRDKGKSRPSMTDGCDEKFDWEYYKWIWNYPKTKKIIYELLNKYKDSRKIIVFRNRKETNKFLNGLISHETGVS